MGQAGYGTRLAKSVPAALDARIKTIPTPIGSTKPKIQGPFTVACTEDLTEIFLMTANNPDGDMTGAVWEVVVSASTGTVGINAATGTVTYAPATNYNGTDSFTIKVTDAEGDVSDTETVTLNIAAVDDSPTVTGSGIPDISVQDDAANTVLTLTDYFEDVDTADAATTFSIVSDTGNTGEYTTTLSSVVGTNDTLTIDFVAATAATRTVTIQCTDGVSSPVSNAFDIVITSSFTNAYSMEFDGSNAHMDTGYRVGAGSALPLSAWAKGGSGSGPEMIMGDSNNGGSFAATRVWFGFYNETVYTVMGDGTDYWFKRGEWTYDASSTFFDDNWHHLALVINGKDQYFYIDSVLRHQADTLDLSGSWTGSHRAYTSSGAALGTTQVADQFVAVGTSGSASSTPAAWLGGGFSGHIDEPAIFESALDSTAISALYSGGTPDTVSGAVAWWRMGDGDSPTTGGSLPDAVTNQGSGGVSYVGDLHNAALYREDVAS